MALIKCPECGKEVSNMAAACPNCGYGIREHFEQQQRVLAAIEHQRVSEIKKQEAATKAIQEREKRIEETKLPEKPKKGRIIFNSIMCGIMALIGWFGVFTGLGVIWLIIAILFTVLTVSAPKFYKEEVGRYEYATKNPNEYKRSVVEEDEKRTAEAKEQARKRLEALDAKAKAAPRCPKCGSTYISTVNRGYSIVWGFIGSGNAMNVCQKCGHKWKPRG